MKTSIKIALYRWTLRKVRLLVDAADEWLHTQEATFREARATVEAPQAATDEFSKKASAAREKAIRKTRVARPRLHYEHGQFVRVS